MTTSPSLPPRCRWFLLAGLISTLPLAPAAVAADSGVPASGAEPPTSWIDPDTGHRVIRMTREPGSLSFYFNDNAYTPDGREMAFTTRDGISVLTLATLEERPVVTGPVRAIVVGHKTPTIYYTRRTDNDAVQALWCTNLDTKVTRKIADLPPRASISAINADETLAGGTYLEGTATSSGAYGGGARTEGANGVQSKDKFQMMADRLSAKLPNAMFTVNLQTGAINVILRNTDWLNHLQFSPTDPQLLLYCHEGTWQKVDRIWMIHADGTGNTQVHHRIMEMEQYGHEWWSQDGQNIWYDLRMPEGVLSYMASDNVVNGERSWFLVERNAWSIHYNSSPDGSLFCGDGCANPPGWWATDANKWIYLFHPERVKEDHTLGTNLIRGGVMHAERLVNMAKHNYMLEPNPSFTPDQKFIVFRSNMFGPTYTFEVEVAKADAAHP
jgi:oligogalacturonide lyase